MKELKAEDIRSNLAFDTGTGSLVTVTHGTPIGLVSDDDTTSMASNQTLPTIKPSTDEEEDEISIEEDPDNNYRSTICKNCVIYDVVGCEQCGIFIYGHKHNEYKFKVTKL